MPVTRLAIATPFAARNPVWQYTVALARTMTALAGAGVQAELIHVAGMPYIPTARNMLVAQFLAARADALLFVDDDIGWNPDDVLRLLRSGKQVIGGPYVRRGVDLSGPTAWTFKPAKTLTPADLDRPFEVLGAGTGFLLVARDVFLTLRSDDNWLAGQADWPSAMRANYHEFFAVSRDIHGQLVTEDYYFANLWRAHGGAVWIDPTIKLKHIGHHEFEADIATAAATRFTL